MAWRPWPILLALFATTLALGNTAWAAVEEPLQVGYSYVGDDDYTDDSGLLMAIMDRSSGIDLYEGQSLVDDASAPTDSGLEALLIHRVDRLDGHEIEVIGPQGERLSMVRQSASRPWDEARAERVLREIFDALVPAIREFRDDGGVDEQGQAQRADMTIREQAIAEHLERLGPFESYASLYLGGYYSMRSMEMAPDNGDAVVDLDLDWIGVSARVDGRLSALGSYRSAIEAEGVIAFAPVSATIDGDERSGTAFGLSAELRYINLRNSLLRLRLLGGVESFNLSLEQNNLYTGHGYVMGRAGAGAEFLFGERVTAIVDGLALPIVLASNSGGAYGDPSGWLGAGADASFRIDTGDSLIIRLDYALRYMALEQPDAPEFEETLYSDDWLHRLGLSAGYRF